MLYVKESTTCDKLMSDYSSDINVLKQRVNDLSAKLNVDYVTMRGVSGIWSYTKYDSCRAEILGKSTVSVTATIQSGGLYYSGIYSVKYLFTLSAPMYGFVSAYDVWYIGSLCEINDTEV